VTGVRLRMAAASRAARWSTRPSAGGRCRGARRHRLPVEPRTAACSCRLPHRAARHAAEGPIDRVWIPSRGRGHNLRVSPPRDRPARERLRGRLQPVRRRRVADAPGASRAAAMDALKLQLRAWSGHLLQHLYQNARDRPASRHRTSFSRTDSRVMVFSIARSAARLPI